MVIMNEEKDRSASPKADSAKKTCPRAAKKTEVYAKKPAHTGLKFHFDKKKLITHEFAFSSVSKTEKVTRSRHIDKSLDRQNNAENNSTDSKKIEVLMDTLKISRSEECSSREKSPLRKEMPKSPVVERLTSKKACTRCSRCSKTPKEENPETKPVKIAKEQDPPQKTTKKENLSTKSIKLIPQFMKPTESKKQYLKLAKPLEPQEKTLKPKSILIHSEKPALHDNEKNDASRNGEAPLSPKPMARKKQNSKLAKLLVEPKEKNSIAKSSTEKSDAKNCEKSLSNTEKPTAEKPHCANEKKVEFWPTSEAPVSMIVMNSETVEPEPNDKGKSEIVNGTEHPTESDTIACLLNGRHDEHICDPHYGLESPSGTKVSKIPRKTPGAVGLKPDASMNKDLMSQQLIEL